MSGVLLGLNQRHQSVSGEAGPAPGELEASREPWPHRKEAREQNNQRTIPDNSRNAGD